MAVFQIFQLRARGSVFSLPDVHGGATTPSMVPFHRSWAVYDFDAFFRFCSVNTRNSQNLAENGGSGGCYAVHVAGSPCHRMAYPTWTTISPPPLALAIIV